MPCNPSSTPQRSHPQGDSSPGTGWAPRCADRRRTTGSSGRRITSFSRGRATSRPGAAAASTGNADPSDAMNFSADPGGCTIPVKAHIMGSESKTPETALPRTILVVEDEKEIQDLLAHYLRKEGFSPLLASDGETAILKARK